MTEKVKVTQKQAAAIEGLRENKFENDEIIRKAVRVKYTTQGNGRWFETLSAMDLDTLIKALYVGYEVESDFEVGDWVHVSWSNGTTDIHKVLRTGVWNICGEENGIEIDWKNNPTPPLRIIRHATPEEITEEKERRFWEELGRDVREFKNGDVGVLRNGLITSSLRNLESYSDDLIGLYPAESFIKFGGGDK